MAKQFGSQLDLQKIPVLNLVMQTAASGNPPSSPTNGQLWYDTTNNKAKVYENGSWVDIYSTAAAGGPAGGDLSGSYPNPQIATGVIVDADVAAANKDGAVGTPSLRTLGFTSQQALAGNTRLNTLLSNTAPNGNCDFGGNRIINLADPTGPTDAATKSYVDTAAQGLDAKQSVKCASTTDFPLINAAGTFDGITPVIGDRVLLKNQTAPAQNGVYSVAAGDSHLYRTSDMDAWTEVPGAFVFVEQGTTQADTGWVCTSDQGGTLGTTAVTWVQFSGAGQITAGAGLTKTGNTLDVGQGTGITVAADTVALDTAYADGRYALASAAGTVRKYTAVLGALSAGVALNIVHNLNTTDVIAAFRLVSTNADMVLDWRVVDAYTIAVTPDVAYSANSMRVVVMG